MFLTSGWKLLTTAVCITLLVVNKRKSGGKRFDRGDSLTHPNPNPSIQSF